MNLNKRKIIVTGGAGMIGYALVKRLAKNNLVRVIDSFERSCVSYQELSKIVECINCDIRNTDELRKHFDGFDVVVHLAAYGSVVESINDPLPNFQVNVEGTLSVLEAIKTSTISRIVFSSTGGAIMGNTPPPVSEVSLPSPISPYGASKLCCEGYIRAYSESYGIDAVIFRFANVYGNFSAHKKGAVTKFIKSTLTDENISIFGDGMATRDFLHVDDLCDGLISGVFSQIKGSDIFHLASGEGTTVLELAEIILSLKPSSRTKIKFKESRKGEVIQNFADATKANIELDFTPKITLIDGLKSTFDWFRDLPSSEIIQQEYDS